MRISTEKKYCEKQERTVCVMKRNEEREREERKRRERVGEKEREGKYAASFQHDCVAR